MFDNPIPIAALILSLITALTSAWNGYQNAKLGRVIAELHFNIMKDMNGRYVRLDSMTDAKERIKRLEEYVDEH